MFLKKRKIPDLECQEKKREEYFRVFAATLLFLSNEQGVGTEVGGRKMMRVD